MSSDGIPIVFDDDIEPPSTADREEPQHLVHDPERLCESCAVIAQSEMDRVAGKVRKRLREKIAELQDELKLERELNDELFQRLGLTRFKEVTDD